MADAATHLLDPQGRDLAARIQWWRLPGLGAEWPVALVGAGPPVLLLHGFDSSFLEFRRLAPLLAPHCQLFIPDLYGFGFCPRPSPPAANPADVLRHLGSLMAAIGERTPGTLGLIGASMGGSVAVELARRCPERIDRLLLLAPAGLTGNPMPLPPVLDGLGVKFLALPWVRKGLCRSAFANPDQDVGEAELEIASLHLQAPGWAETLGPLPAPGALLAAAPPCPSSPSPCSGGPTTGFCGLPRNGQPKLC